MTGPTLPNTGPTTSQPTGSAGSTAGAAATPTADPAATAAATPAATRAADPATTPTADPATTPTADPAATRAADAAAQPRWLDAEEQRAWLSTAATMALLDAALDRALQADAGVSHAQYGIMSQLSVAPNRSMHMSALAAMTSSSHSRLSHAVSTLEANGWATRRRCPENRRAVHATLTDAGYALVVAAAPGHVTAVRRLLIDRLTREQVGQLEAITTAVLAALAEEGFATPIWAE